MKTGTRYRVMQSWRRSETQVDVYLTVKVLLDNDKSGFARTEKEFTHSFVVEALESVS